MSSNDQSEMTWIRSRPSSAYSYREGLSRGSQTSASDLGEINDILEVQSRPTTPSVRRSSLILGDLRALYAVRCQSPELRDLSENPWRKVFRDKVLQGLDETCRLRQAQQELCLSLRKKSNRRLLASSFFCWRGKLVRSLKSDLEDRIKNEATPYFRQRKKSVLQVWSHVALGLNSKKKILERRRGGIERARESLTKRLAEKGEAGLIVTPEMIDAEISRIMNTTLSTWMAGYSKRTYFTSWRHHTRRLFEQSMLAKKHNTAKMKRKLLVAWLVYTKVCIDRADGNFINYKRLAEANAFNKRKVVVSVLQSWMNHTKVMMAAKTMRRRILSRTIRVCVVEWKRLVNQQRSLKHCVLMHWINIETDYMKHPFRCWRNIVDNNRCRLDYQMRLVKTFVRSKSRRKIYQLFHQWLHQTRYGRVTSLYTRNQLASGWIESKQRYEHLQEEMRSKIESHNELVATVCNLEEKLKVSERERLQAQDSLAEVKRINECLSRVNPICADHVLALFPLFGHKVL
jgi:hypothetical protein